jgi:hypothetical protein
LSGARPDVVVAAARLRAALDDTAAALAGADLDRLLATDALLQKVLSEIHAGPVQPWSGHGTATPALREEIEQAQAALRRCRRLGAVVGDFVRLSLDAQGAGLGYEPSRTAAAALNGRTLNERV